MPLRTTKFRGDWLLLNDNNGTKVSEWCIKGSDDFSGYCLLCKTTVNISNSGKTQLMQHANTAKHKLLDGARKDSSQSRLVNRPGTKDVFLNINRNNSDKPTWILSEEEKLYKTEILWVIHTALNNYSFLSCDSVKTLFCQMFPDSSLPKGLQLCSRKVSYTVSHGLGPYFLKQIADEFKKSLFFTLMYDETLNEQNLKQLDVHVRFWNSKENVLSERYIGSELMGHATALDISTSIKAILNSCGIDLKFLLMLGSDGPNVNKAVFQLFDKEVKSVRDFGIINVGTCNLHVIHNAFGKGIEIESFTNVVDFLENLHCWFAKFPSRQEDLRKTMENFGEEYSKILRYVSNRWLSLVKVCERILDILPSLKVYFLEDLPKEKRRLVNISRYQTIVKMLKDPLTPVYLNFMISVGSLFEHFLTLLQGKTTLIHLLYDELSKLLLKLMRRFVLEDALKEKHGEKLLDIDVRKQSLQLKKIDIGNKTKRCLSSISPNLKGEFLADAKEFYIVITNYLQKKLPLRNKLLQHLQILHPVMREEPVASSLPSIRQLANLLPMVIPEDCVDKLTDEWRLYVSDLDVCKEWVGGVDCFWNRVFNLSDSNTQSPRYPYLAVIVKAALTFSHGQASVERGFSINKRMLTSERSSMNIDTIRGLRIIKDAVQGNATDVCITQEMIRFYKEAYSMYKAQKDTEREAKKKEMHKKKTLPLEEQQKKNCDKLAGVKDNISSAQSMIDEGNKRLQTGIKRKCLKEIGSAQVLIDAGNKRLKIANDVINKN